MGKGVHVYEFTENNIDGCCGDFYHNISVLLYVGVDQRHQGVDAFKGAPSDSGIRWGGSRFPDEYHYLDCKKYAECRDYRHRSYLSAGDAESPRKFRDSLSSSAFPS